MGQAGLLPAALELRHDAPVALGHVGHAAPGVVAALDGDDVVELPPQPPAVQLLFPRRTGYKVLRRQDGPLPRPGQQQLGGAGGDGAEQALFARLDKVADDAAGEAAQSLLAEAMASSFGLVEKVDFDSLTFETADE